MINIYRYGKETDGERVASVSHWDYAWAVCTAGRGSREKFVLKENGRVKGHYIYGHWEPKGK